MRTLVRKSLLPVMLLAITAVSASPALAQNRDDRWRVSVQAPAPPEVYFQYAPHWQNVRGTQVYTLRDQDRPDYDMFRYSNSYYIYNDGYWYRADRWNGPFVAIDYASVPNDFRAIPREEWVSYPTNWANGYNNGTDDRYNNGYNNNGYGNNGYYNNGYGNNGYDNGYYNNTRARARMHHHHRTHWYDHHPHHHHSDDQD